MIRDLIIKNRSCRRFDQSVRISAEQVKNWVELARFSASARNMQTLKFIISSDETVNKQLFQHLGWAGYLTYWQGPEEGERPVAYVIVLHDKSLSENYSCDDGIAMQSILLGAVEDGFGGCIIGTVNKGKVAKILRLPENLEVLWVIALGKPAEKIELETTIENNIKYWRGEDGTHHVPKRPLDEIIFKTIE